MKKGVILLVLGILLASLINVIAIPNPSSTYCKNMGYTQNETHCIFSNINSCDLWKFYNGSCGIEYIKNLSCAKAGESLEPGKICCEGLKAISTIGYNKEDGTCENLLGAWPICAPCGDNVCNETFENKCNCVIDCGFPEINISKIKERIQNRTNITFLPWQKRNESECLQGCKCVGAVMSCITETGKTMTVTAGSSGNVIIIIIEKTNVTTELEIEQESVQNKTRIKAKVSRGYIEIKIMPDTASERALEKLKLKVCSIENNCTIVLKEVSQREGTQLAYELQAERHGRILGLFRTKMQVKAQIDAENGEIIMVKKPWWAFLASEAEE